MCQILATTPCCACHAPTSSEQGRLLRSPRQPLGLGGVGIWRREGARKRICDGDLGEEGDLSVWVWERCGDSTAGWEAPGTNPTTASRARLVPFTLSRRPGVVTCEGRVGGADPSRLSSQAKEDKVRRRSGVSGGGMWMAEREQHEHTAAGSVVGQQKPCAP
jgi:hypothetical protein